MVSDQEIAKGVEILLSQSDPKSFTTLGDVVQRLGEKLGFDLSHKALFIRDQINLLLFRSQTYHPPPPPPPVSQPGTAKEHFVLPQQQQRQHAQFHFGQAQAQVPQFHHHPHFAVQQQHQQQQRPPQRLRHPVELNFSNPAAVASPPPPPQSQVQASPEVKAEGGGVVVHNAAGNSSEKPKKGGSTGNKKRGGPGGLNKLCGISPELQVIVGESALSRTDIVKQLWAYIKKHNLQDPGNKRKIVCDDALRVVFETDCTDMFQMNKLLAKHIIRLEPTKESSRKRSKVNAEPVTKSTDVVPCQVVISEALASCLGTEEREMSQAEALRLVWEYIKVNNLEDPENPATVVCDANLRELFWCDSISTMGIPELLVRHHFFRR